MRSMHVWKYSPVIVYLISREAPNPWATLHLKSTGTGQFASRIQDIPVIQYGEDRCWVSTDGHMGVSEWKLAGASTSGKKLKLMGCNL
jgi:hypothetical protein